MLAIEQQIKEIEEVLDQFEVDSIGISKCQKIQEPECLHLSIENIRRKTPEHLCEYSLELARYSLYIERCTNKLKAQERWVKIKLDELTAHFLKDIPSRYGWNERTLIARNDPEPCKALNMVLKEIEMKLARLYNIPKHIEIISKCIDNLRFIALKREKSD